MVNTFDLKAVLLEKHAQHVVLIHFPIALFVAAIAFDLIALWTKRRGLADAAYYNLLAAAISTLPVLVTGLPREKDGSDWSREGSRHPWLPCPRCIRSTPTER